MEHFIQIAKIVTKIDGDIMNMLHDLVPYGVSHSKKSVSYRICFHMGLGSIMGHGSNMVPATM